MRDWKSTAAFKGLGQADSTAQDPFWKQLIDIARLDWDACLRDARMRNTEIGPNSWDDVTRDDFGTVYDYEILDQVDRWILYPVCEAALQWCYRYLPPDSDRWSTHGFIIPYPLDHWRSKQLFLLLDQCGLRSEDDAEAENNELARQW